MAQHVYSVTQNYNLAGQFCSNVYHWQFDDAGYLTTAAAANALLVAWLTRDLNNFQNIFPGGCTFLTWHARKVDDVGGFEAVQTINPGTVGGRVGVLQVSGVGPVVIHYPIANGRRRGRTFFPGCTDTDCIDGILTGALKALIATKLGIIYDDLTLAGGGAPTAIFGLWSRKDRIFNRVQVSRLSDIVGTQRRRQQPV